MWDSRERSTKYQMKQNLMLSITSLLLNLLLTLHLADDIRRGFEKGALANLIAVPIVVLWLYAALVLVGRRSGYIVILLLSLFSLVVPIVHMKGRGVGVASSIARSGGGFFFIWTLIAIGVIALFSVVLSVRGLWGLPWRRLR